MSHTTENPAGEADERMIPERQAQVLLAVQACAYSVALLIAAVPALFGR